MVCERFCRELPHIQSLTLEDQRTLRVICMASNGSAKCRWSQSTNQFLHEASSRTGIYPRPLFSTRRRHGKHTSLRGALMRSNTHHQALIMFSIRQCAACVNRKENVEINTIPTRILFLFGYGISAGGIVAVDSEGFFPPFEDNSGCMPRNCTEMMCCPCLITRIPPLNR